jgi:hypothetical protein
MSGDPTRFEVEIDSVLMARLDRVAAFAKQAGLAALSRDDLITDAIERYVFSAEMAAPGLTSIPLEPDEV